MGIAVAMAALITFALPAEARNYSIVPEPAYMDIEQQTAGPDDSDIAELLMQHSVLGIVQIKKQVRACQNRENFPHNFYDLLLELLDTEQFNLRCLQAFL